MTARTRAILGAAKALMRHNVDGLPDWHDLPTREQDYWLHEAEVALDGSGVFAIPARDEVEGAVGRVLFNSLNHPDPAAVWGKNLGPLRTKVVDAVMELLSAPNGETWETGST